MARRLAVWATLMLACAALGVAAAPAAMPAASWGAAVPASPSLTPSPTPTPTPALSPCCATLAASGYVRTPGVPAVLITTAASAPPDRTKRPATLCTCGAGDVGTGADGSPVVDWAGPIRLKNRGGVNTQRYNKIRQYAAYLPKAAQNGSGTAAPHRRPPPPPLVLGLAGDHLVFLGQANDTAGLKESFGRDLARAMGWAGGSTPAPPPASPYATWAAPPGPLGWVPRTVHAELFLVDDGGSPPGSAASHYRGLYLVSEHISRGAGKLDLPKAGAGEPRTAAIATFLHGETDPDGSTLGGPAPAKIEWQVKWPAVDKLSGTQKAGLEADLAGFEAALAEAGLADANSTAGWRAWMEPASFIDWFLHTELTKVAKKSYHSAAFMTKLTPGGPWVMGPVWAQLQGFGTCCGYNFIQQPSGYNGPSLNGSFGPPLARPPAALADLGGSGGSGISPHGWLFSICSEAPSRCTPLESYDPGNGLANWFYRAFTADPTFAPAAAARWATLRAGPWSDEAVAAMMAAKRALLDGPPLQRTLARWPAELGKPWRGDGAAQAAAVFEDVAAWTAARLSWLDKAWAQAADPATRGRAYPAAFAK